MNKIKQGKQGYGWLMLLSWIAMMATSVQASTLEDVSFVSLPGNKLEVKLDFDELPQTPKSYQINSPARVVFDFWETDSALDIRELVIQSGQVDKLNIAQAGGRLRIVANLFESVGYEVEPAGNSLRLVFDGRPTLTASPVQTASVRQQVAQAKAKSAINTDLTRVQGLDFERTPGDQGRIVVTLSDDQAALDIHEEGSNVIVNLKGAQLAQGLAKRLDVEDFATPVRFIDAMQSGKMTSILISPDEQPYDYQAYQLGNKLVLDFKPLTSAQQAELAQQRFPYDGEKIDLNFQSVDIRAVLKIIAEVAELNLVVDDAVSGSITLRLKNVPWDQALDIVLKTRGLDKRELGNVLLVANAEDIANREALELKNQQQVEELAPLVTEYIQVNYRAASEIDAAIKTAELLSERGFMLADDQTNVLLVRDTRKQIDAIRRMIKRFDVEVAQILIEARLVTASTDFTKDIGIRWGAGYAYDEGGNSVTVGGSPNAPGFISGIGEGANVPGNLNVDLGVSPQSSIAIGYASDNALVQAEISALQSEGKAEIISQPKVITSNGKPASIKSGQEIAYQTVEDGEVNIEFKDVVLGLDVTPQINPGGRISLDLKINQDSVASITDSGEITLNKNELNTSVTVADGETVVLGGVYQSTQAENVAKTPLLGDIPVLGNLFKKRERANNKVELLIFITPKLIRESLNVQ